MWKGQREILALLLKTQSNNIVAGNQGSKGLKHNYSVKGSVVHTVEGVKERH